MKEIGIEFKTKREEIGLSLEEVSQDLDVTIPQLENLEDGNINAFKDVFFLKELIKKYSIYLNIDDEEIIKDFNNFVFDFTSKIPIQEIENKIKEIEKKEDEKVRKSISSPYTEKRVLKAKMKPVYWYAIITVILCMLVLIIANTVVTHKNKENKVGYVIGGKYEFTK